MKIVKSINLKKRLVISSLILLILFSAVESISIDEGSEYKVKVGTKTTYKYTKIEGNESDWYYQYYSEIPSGYYDYVTPYVGMTFTVKLNYYHALNGNPVGNITVGNMTSQGYAIYSIPYPIYMLESSFMGFILPIYTNTSRWEENANQNENISLDGDIYSLHSYHKSLGPYSKIFTVDSEWSITTGWLTQLKRRVTDENGTLIVEYEFRKETTETPTASPGFIGLSTILGIIYVTFIVRKRRINKISNS